MRRAAANKAAELYATALPGVLIAAPLLVGCCVQFIVNVPFVLLSALGSIVLLLFATQTRPAPAAAPPAAPAAVFLYPRLPLEPVEGRQLEEPDEPFDPELDDLEPELELDEPLLDPGFELELEPLLEPLETEPPRALPPLLRGWMRATSLNWTAGRTSAGSAAAKAVATQAMVRMRMMVGVDEERC